MFPYPTLPCRLNTDSWVEYLHKLKPNILLDISLHDHVETLDGAVKTKVVVLEKEVGALITAGQIDARIDFHNKHGFKETLKYKTKRMPPNQVSAYVTIHNIYWIRYCTLMY